MSARFLPVAAGLVLAGGAKAMPVPFVGCPSDGQIGPQPAPEPASTPDLPRAAARRLAYYRSGNDAVLAPRGWHCFGTYGSNGSTLLVTPGPLDWKRATASGGIAGPAVQVSTSLGDTSGRFEVAAIAALAFPAARAFVGRVEAEGLAGQPFRRAPYPADKRTRRGPYQLLFTTAAGRQGLGTRSRLAPGALPIDGVLWLHPREMNLTSLAVRLSREQRPLVAEIIRDAAPPPSTAMPTR